MNSVDNADTKHHLTRREFVGVSAMTTAAIVSGCATNPVTGKSQMMFISPEGEIKLDQQHSPHQFSADYGAIQDLALQKYIHQLTVSMGERTHRPGMPYSGRGLNASYVNGYIFPGGTMAVTRGLLAQIEDEATLAALIGHELGHVNARHTAQRMTKSIVAMLVLAGAGVAVAAKNEEYAPLVIGLGGIGAGALLAKYSRDDERQADALGMEYMVRSEYSPQGMVSLMQILRGMNKRKPGAIEIMFSSHPMSDERYETARKRADNKYQSAQDLPFERERYMDMTAGIRARKEMLGHLQDGDQYMREKKWSAAQTEYAAALKNHPADYEALMKMSKCYTAQENYDEALHYVSLARQAYTNEPQSYQLGGVIALRAGQYERAHNDFEQYAQMLPGNPLTDFLNGRALEGMGRKDAAAQHYKAYLKQVQSGDEAQYARDRLAEWGYS